VVSDKDSGRIHLFPRPERGAFAESGDVERDSAATASRMRRRECARSIKILPSPDCSSHSLNRRTTTAVAVSSEQRASQGDLNLLDVVRGIDPEIARDDHGIRRTKHPRRLALRDCSMARYNMNRADQILRSEHGGMQVIAQKGLTHHLARRRLGGSRRNGIEPNQYVDP
jgi:hypothetical protein